MPPEHRRAVRSTSLTQAGADLPDQLRRALADRPLKVEAEWRARPAAVLVPLYQTDGAWHALFTRRTETVDSHRGQVSFPGGQPDDAQAASLICSCGFTELAKIR